VGFPHLFEVAYIPVISCGDGAPPPFASNPRASSIAQLSCLGAMEQAKAKTLKTKQSARD